MKIVLSTLNAKYIHSSLALRYLKAYSQREFSDIEIVEYSIKEPILNLLSDLYKKKPDVIGFSCYIWNIEETLELVQLIKKVMPDVSIVLGGPEVSYDIKYWLERVKGIDYIVYGEGEHTFYLLLKALMENGNISEINGLAYKLNDSFVITPPQKKLNLNDLPSPYQDEEDIEALRDKIVYFEASRGCPFSCAYCLSSADTGVRFFELERVKRDLLKLMNSGVKTIKFVDRTFNINKKFAIEIFKFLIDNNIRTVFQFEITADIMHRDVLQFLVENAPANYFRFEIGIQSTNEYTNSLINRRQNFKKLSTTVLKLKENKKIDLHLDLIAGLPEEDYSSFRKTFNDVFALRPEELQLGFLKILRGTQMWREASKYNYVYMEKAPYEIFQNSVLSFTDIIKIKSLEDVLEKYWNSNRMNNTVEYLITHEFETPFDFFQEFGLFWEEKGWNRIGHQIETLFERLNQFLKVKAIPNLDFVQSLMKLDYFLNHNYKPRKTWWEFNIPKQQQMEFLQEIVARPDLVTDNFVELNLDERTIHKHIMIETSKFDIYSYLQDGKIIERDTLVIVYYNPPEKPKLFFKSK